MKDRKTARMRKYGESKTTRIMMATVPHITSGLGLRKFQADGFLLTRVYHLIIFCGIVFKECNIPENDEICYPRDTVHFYLNPKINLTPFLFSVVHTKKRQP
jgi:hypothetical protein